MTIASAPLKAIADIRVSNVDKKSVAGERQVRLCNYVDVYKNDSVSASNNYMRATATLDQIQRFRLRRGDSVITKDSETADDIAVPTFVEDSAEDILCGYHLAIIRPLSGVDPKFLNWALNSDHLRTQMSVAATGVTRFGLRQEAIGSAAIPVPELAEQRRIADFLDAETSRLDALVQAKAAQSELLVERLRSHLAGQFIPEESVPPGWSTVRLKHLFKLRTGGFWGSDPTGTSTDVLCARVADFDRLNFKTVPNISTARSIPEEQLLNKALEPGDLLLEKSGGGEGSPVGFAVSYAPTRDRPTVCSNFITLLRPASHVDPRFAALLMASLYLGKQNLPFVRQTTGIQNLDVNGYLGLRVIAPTTRREQSDIARSADSVISVTTRGLEVLKSQRRLLSERRRAMITAAVTGQIDAKTAQDVADRGL